MTDVSMQEVRTKRGMCFSQEDAFNQDELEWASEGVCLLYVRWIRYAESWFHKETGAVNNQAAVLETLFSLRITWTDDALTLSIPDSSAKSVMLETIQGTRL